MAEAMDLKTFVSTTLSQIIEGVAEAVAQIEKSGTDAKINPYRSDDPHSRLRDVEFDVAVTVSGSKSGGGGAGISIAAFQIGGKGQVKSTSEAISRIKFVVAIASPGMKID